MKLKIFTNKLLIILTIISTIVYLAWRTFFTIPFGTSYFALIWGIALLLVEFIGMIEAVIHFKNMSNISCPERPEIREEDYLDVDVFIATYNESTELLYKTINGCINMDYPDKSKVHIYVCDDGNRSEMKELARRLGVNYITREEQTDSKAGNFNNALKQTKSPLVVTFNADMIPMHDFLMACVPYFYLEKKVGFVQTPQSFYNPDLFQYNLYSEGRIPNERDHFYKDIQVSRNKTNSVEYSGSNTMLSREALEEIGGFYTKTITEDFATGMLIQSRGYRCYALDEVHASGLSPSDLKSLMNQRKRWARGYIQIGRKLNILFRKGLNFKQKLSYMLGITYWHFCLKRLIYIISPILYSIFGIVFIKCTLQEVLIFWLPMYMLNSITLKKLSNNIRSNRWTNVYETILFPSLIMPVFLETIGISHKKSSEIQKKEKIYNDKLFRIKSALPLATLAILSVVGIGIGSINAFQGGLLINIACLIWLTFNLYTLAMSIFFMSGRKIFRRKERLEAAENCVISYDNRNVQAVTKDISESGIAIILDEPKYLPYNRDVSITLSTDRYTSNFLGKIVHVEQFGNKWRYAFSINQIDEENFRGLSSIIYDREPTLPKNIEKHDSAFEDIRINISKRKNGAISLNRKLPRIELNKKVDTDACNDVIIVNFNYEYVVLRLHNSYFENLKAKITHDIVLDFSFRKEVSRDENNMVEILYYINNNKEIINNDKFQNILLSWIIENEQAIEEKKLEQKKNNDEFDETIYA